MKRSNFEKDDMQLSRSTAATFRGNVLHRSKGRCELCGDHVPYILESHHVVPVAKLGSGWPDNLIALCPNCHAIAEKLQSSMIDNPHFHDWIRSRYGEDGYKKFERLFTHTWGNEADGRSPESVQGQQEPALS